MGTLSAIIAAIAGAFFTGATIRLIRDLLAERRRWQTVEQAPEITIEFTKKDGEVRQVTVAPEDERSIRRFLATVGEGEPVTR